MTDFDPFEERARLYDELRRVQENGDLASRDVAEADRLHNGLASKEREVYMRHARGQAGDEDLAEFKRYRAEVAQRLADASARANASHSARQAIENELGRLYGSHLAAFMEEAEERTQAVARALAELQPQYQAAVAAWGVAMGAWAPLLPAVRVDLEAQNRERGLWPPEETLRGQSSVPECPLPDPASIFGNVAARPRGVDADLSMLLAKEHYDVDLVGEMPEAQVPARPVDLA